MGKKLRPWAKPLQTQRCVQYSQVVCYQQHQVSSITNYSELAAVSMQLADIMDCPARLKLVLQARSTSTKKTRLKHGWYTVSMVKDSLSCLEEVGVNWNKKNPWT